jgi:endonuclease/exonuclease/phosphatase family metal-dependent hydrolase
VPTFRVLILAIAALGVWAWSFAGNKETTSGPTPAGNPQPAVSNTVRVMTANVRLSQPEDGENAWPNRRDLLVKTVLKYGPDILGCQEVSPAQGAFLIKELGKWYDYYPRAGVGKIAADDSSTTGRLLGAVNQSFAALNTLFYRSDRFDCIDGEAGLVLPNELQREPSENTFYTLAVLQEKAATKRIFIVVDTHLRHHEEFATKCALGIREKIGAVLKTHPGAKVIVMGDMNHDRRSKVYAALAGVEGAADGAGVLADSFDYSRKRPNELWGNWHAFTGKPRRDLPTDLIFSSGLTSKGAEFVRDHDDHGHYPSDHFFVTTDLLAK